MGWGGGGLPPVQGICYQRSRVYHWLGIKKFLICKYSKWKKKHFLFVLLAWLLAIPIALWTLAVHFGASWMIVENSWCLAEIFTTFWMLAGNSRCVLLPTICCSFPNQVPAADLSTNKLAQHFPPLLFCEVKPVKPDFCAPGPGSASLPGDLCNGTRGRAEPGEPPPLAARTMAAGTRGPQASQGPLSALGRDWEVN